MGVLTRDASSQSILVTAKYLGNLKQFVGLNEILNFVYWILEIQTRARVIDKKKFHPTNYVINIWSKNANTVYRRKTVKQYLRRVTTIAIKMGFSTRWIRENLSADRVCFSYLEIRQGNTKPVAYFARNVSSYRQKMNILNFLISTHPPPSPTLRPN